MGCIPNCTVSDSQLSSKNPRTLKEGTFIISQGARQECPLLLVHLAHTVTSLTFLPTRLCWQRWPYNCSQEIHSHLRDSLHYQASAGPFQLLSCYFLLHLSPTQAPSPCLPPHSAHFVATLSTSAQHKPTNPSGGTSKNENTLQMPVSM